LKRRAKIFLVAAAAVVVVIASVPLFVNANTFRPAVEKELALGRTVKVGDLRLSVFSGSMLSKDLSVADDPNFSSEPFLTAKTLRIGVSLRPLILSHERELRSIEIESPQINFIRAANGTWNFSSIGRLNAAYTPNGSSVSNPPSAPSRIAASSIPPPSVALIEVENGRVAIATFRHLCFS
jgi:AsmA protein